MANIDDVEKVDALNMDLTDTREETAKNKVTEDEWRTSYNGKECSRRHLKGEL